VGVVVVRKGDSHSPRTISFNDGRCTKEGSSDGSIDIDFDESSG